MRVFNSSLAASLKKIKKTHKRTKSVSWIYAIGIILLTVLAFLPTVNIQFAGGESLFIGSFFWPLIRFIQKKTDVVDLLVMVLYIAMVVILLVNMFRCLSKFGKILRRTSGNVTTCNKNLAILEEIGNIYSGSLAAYIIFNFIIYMITGLPEKVPVLFGALTIFGVAGLVVGLVVHFWTAVLSAKVSVFIIGATIEEKKREDKVAPFFLRNLVQVLAIAGILYFFLDASNVYIELKYLFMKNEVSAFTNIGGDFFAFLAVILQLLVIVTVAVLIKHATALTEYNRIGMDGVGMYNFRVFGLATALLCIVLFIFDVDPRIGRLFNYLFAAAIAIVGVVLDFIIVPREKKVKVVEEDPMLDKYKENYEPEKKPEQAQFPPQAANCCLYARPCYPTGIPPQEQAAEKEEAEKEENDSQQDKNETNIYYTMVNGKMVPVSKDNLPDGLPEGLPPTAPTILNVLCPTCGKTLAVKDSVEYHRCPACGKVFQIRKGKKMGGAGEDVVNADEVSDVNETSDVEETLDEIE